MFLFIIIWCTETQNWKKKSIQHSEHGESLISRKGTECLYIGSKFHALKSTACSVIIMGLLRIIYKFVGFRLICSLCWQSRITKCCRLKNPLTNSRKVSLSWIHLYTTCSVHQGPAIGLEVLIRDALLNESAVVAWWPVTLRLVSSVYKQTWWHIHIPRIPQITFEFHADFTKSS